MAAAEQIIFTSCRYAIGGGSGFQVKSQSPGVDPTDLNTVTQRSDYQRPLSPDGAAEERPADCPVAVRWYALPQGGRALTRIVYVGSDYTGRPGNFLAHTLAFPAAEARHIDPVAWFDWAGWLDALPAGSDDSPTVAALPPVHWTPAAARVPAPPPGLDARMLERALAALFEAVREGRPLVLDGSARDNIDSFRLLARCLPPSHVAGTEFSTYEHNLRRLPALSMTVPGTAIDPHSGRQNGFVGATLTGASREVPDAEAGAPAGQRYGRIVSRVVFERPELASKLSALLASVAMPPGPDLVTLAQVFLLVETGEEPDAPPLELLRFVAGQRENPVHAALVPALLARLPPQVPEGLADRMLLARAWATAMGLARAAAQGPAGARAYLDVLLAALPDWPASEGAVDEVHHDLAAAWGDGFDDLLLQAVRSDGAAVRAAFLAASPEGASALLDSLSATLGGAPTSPEMAELVHALVGAANAADRLAALVRATIGAEHRAGLFEMARRAPDRAPRELSTLLGETLNRAAARLPAPEAAALRAKVPADLLLSEWQAAFAGADPIAASDALGRAYDGPGLLARLSPPQRTPLNLAAARAFSRVGAEQRLFQVLLALDEKGVLAEQPVADRTRWIALVNDGLRLDAPASEGRKARIALLEREKERLDDAPRPDRAALSILLEEIVGGRKPGEKELTLLSDLAAVSEPERRYARTALLTVAFRGLSSKRDGGLHAALMSGPLRALGRDAAGYRDALQQLVPRGDASALVALLSWWFFEPDAAECQSLWSSVVRDLAVAAGRIDEVATGTPIGTRFATAENRPRANRQRIEQWRKAYEAGPDDSLLRSAGRRVAGLLAGFGKKKP